MSNPIIQVFRSKLNAAVILLIILLFIGVVGFKVMTDYSWIDSVYMTVITITTVGFGEVKPLDDETKIFTIFLILTSVIIVGYAIKVITEYIINRNAKEEIKQKKMQRKVDSMSNHVIICGYGRNGRQAALKLGDHKQDFVVIEKNKDLIEKFQSDDIPFVFGNANEDEVLVQAGIERASYLITALPSDADNLFVVLSARQMKPDIRIISRATQESSYKKLKLAGANNVILPDRIGGDHMASLVVVPDLIEFIDNLSIIGDPNVNVEEVSVDKLYNTTQVKTIHELDLRRQTGCNVIGYKKPDGTYIINPGANQKLEPNSRLIVLGRPEQIQKLNTIYDL